MNDEGYVHLRGVLSAAEVVDALERLRPIIGRQSAPLATLSAHGATPAVQAKSDSVLAGIGFTDAYMLGAVCVNKLPKEPARKWHNDWRWWHLPISYQPQPVQIGAIFYFRDADASNGCLRIAPRTHLGKHDFRSQEPPQSVDVCVAAGDLVLIDARLWHATHANKTDEHREAVNFWYRVDPSFDIEQPMDAEYLPKVSGDPQAEVARPMPGLIARCGQSIATGRRWRFKAAAHNG